MLIFFLPYPLASLQPHRRSSQETRFYESNSSRKNKESICFTSPIPNPLELYNQYKAVRASSSPASFPSPVVSG